MKHPFPTTAPSALAARLHAESLAELPAPIVKAGLSKLATHSLVEGGKRGAEDARDGRHKGDGAMHS